MLIKLFKRPDGKEHPFEECYYIEVSRELNDQELDRLKWLIKTPGTSVREMPGPEQWNPLEIGPRLSVETSFSSNAVAMCRAMELPVLRIEMSTRFRVGDGYGSREELVAKHLDPMTHQVYESTITTFDSGVLPASVAMIPILSQGEEALREANKVLGLGMDAWDITHWTELFRQLGRNPTDVELFQIGNGNSEHSRHWFFRGIQIIDGVEMPRTLMDIVKETLRPGSNSLVAFHDNAGVMRGYEVDMFIPEFPGGSSNYCIRRVRVHFTATAETHNHPTLIAPFPGAETGAGGRIRDIRAVGRGGIIHAGLAGYCVGNLHIPGYIIPGETVGGEVSRRHAPSLQILIRGSDGVSDYGNKIGEPLISGFTRTFGQMVSGARREFAKPVLFTAGIGHLFDGHVEKRRPEKGMKIVGIGGPAFRIGVGGGSASSMVHGSQGEELDFKSVQRGDAQMENRANRAIQAWAEMLDDNPIESIHDQGAGGPSNVLTELMEPVGGRVDIQNIIVGDVTMSVLERWVAEYQERYGLLVRPERLEVFQSICERERVNCEMLGEITGDGNVVVYDSADDTTPVNLPLKDVVGELPQKRFFSTRLDVVHEPFVIPEGLTAARALEMIFKLPHVGSKAYLVHKVDRSVTGLVAQQQCCGPMQVPVSDVGVLATSYFGTTGVATALGEQPTKMLISTKAGARMAVAEMLTNMASARISDIGDIKCRANWMWAAKQKGEGALLYDAAVAMSELMQYVGIGIDGGKDSLSMATQVSDTLVVSPGQLTITGYAPVPDITKVVTPDFKGGGLIGFIDLGMGKNRLGGSALAQAFGQLGNESPDIDDPMNLSDAFKAIQKMIARGLITAYHDRSDGGLITAIAEMCIAGNCGARIDLTRNYKIMERLFSEEAGMVFEFRESDRRRIIDIVVRFRLPWVELGETKRYHRELHITAEGEEVLRTPLVELRRWWEATSFELEKLQGNAETAEAERASQMDGRALEHKLSFTPKKPESSFLRSVQPQLPTVAVLREEGTNGDREMAAAFHATGFIAREMNMQDLLEGREDLDDYQGIALCGGFSYADVFGSAKGWAGSIRFNPQLEDLFGRFNERRDTFSLGVCNGCQLMTLIGWLPSRDMPEASQPRLVHNKSGKFESRWTGVKILESPSVMLAGMEGSVLGIHVAHGEGQFLFPNPDVVTDIRERKLAPLVYVGPDGEATEQYPHNPNGSPDGWAALCSSDGRHLAMMPHPERCFLKWQWPWMPEEFRSLESSPWLQMFVNARNWSRQS